MAQQLEHIKWVPNTHFMVDGFRFQNPRCKHYWLSHYHSDHTIGLTTTFSAGTIFCSAVTANLLVKDMRINPSCIQPLPLNTPLLVDGVHVTLIDANHCPGSVLFLFKTTAPRGSEYPDQVILHTGDMRWHARIGRHPALANQRIDMLFLDTTYASPKYVFPCQEDAIADIVRVMRQHHQAQPATLFVVGSYRIGKERAYLGAAKALGWKVHVNADKLRVLRLLGLPEADMALLTRNADAAQIHVSFMGKLLLPDTLAERIQNSRWTHVVAFRPTGWSFQKSGLSCRREGNVAIYGVPYSEHSSFAELRDCVKTLRPRTIVPTVNASTPAASRALVDRFADLMDLSKDRSRLDFFLRKAKTAPPPPPASSVPVVTFDSDAAGPAAGPASASHAAALKAASGGAKAAAPRSRSAPAELTAGSAAAGGTCSAAERADEWDCGDEEGCVSETCSERGEDAEGAAIDLVSPEKSAGPKSKERLSFRGGWEDREENERRQQDCSTAAHQSAELVHLGLDSPPEASQGAVWSAAAAATRRRPARMHEAERSAPAQQASAKIAILNCRGMDVGGGQEYHRAWPPQPENSTTDSWSSDSWEGPAAAAQQDTAMHAPPETQRQTCLPGSDTEGRNTLQQLDSEEATCGRSSHQQISGQLQSAHTEVPCQNSQPKSLPAADLGQKKHAESEQPRAREGGERRDSACSEQGKCPEAGECQGEVLPEEVPPELAGVDVAEQERILRMILAQSRARPRQRGMEEGSARRRGRGSAGSSALQGVVAVSQAKHRQLSIGAFVMKRASTK